ncbi:uncharacterized protein LOC114410546 [Glycine soja]|uniref:uncharacterized protein LOC114410546 n=1 Tax=Glycine soja TaxID=3848 RepID=UPI00103A2A71|nr:uncharacterized protein LOC114410546 [Glycine soja]
MPRRTKKTMKKKTKTKTTFLPTNTTTFRVKLPTRLTYSLKFDVDELASVYDFRIDKFQRQAILAFLRGFSVVVSAPTSSRKTLIGEAAAELSTISVKLPGAGRALVLCSIWAFCHLCFLFITWQFKCDEPFPLKWNGSFSINSCWLHNISYLVLQSFPLGIFIF